MKTRIGLAFLSALALLASCNIVPIPSAESAKVISKATFDSNQTSASRALAGEELGRSFASPGTTSNPKGGSMTVVVNSDTTLSVTYDKWYVKDDDKEYTISGKVTLKWTSIVASAVDLSTGTMNFSMGYSLKGNLSVANGLRSSSNPIDITCSYKYTSASSSGAMTFTVTCTTSGTIGSDTVNATVSFTSTVSA